MGSKRHVGRSRHRFRASSVFYRPRNFTLPPDDGTPLTTPELAPGLRRLQETDLIYTHGACRVTPVSTSAIADYRPSPLTVKPRQVPPVGAFLFQHLDFNFRTGIVFIQTVIDVLGFDLSVVLVHQSLHAIQDHRLVEIRSA